MSGAQVLRGAGRGLMMLAALAVLAGATGCQRLLKFRGGDGAAEAPQPPDYLKVIGTGSPNTSDVATTKSLSFAGAFQQPVSVDVVVPLDKQIADPAQRVLMARAEARRKALRMLGQAILNTRDSQGSGILSEALQKSPTDQSKLNQLLEEKARVTFSEQSGTAVRASAAIDGPLIVQSLGLLAPKARATGPSGLSAAEAKDLAASLALQNARKNLEQALLETKLPDGRTVKEAMADNPDAAVDFNAMLWVVQPDETLFRPDGSCQVSIFFDRNRLPEIFKNRRHWWQFWKWFPHKPNLL